MLRTHFFYWCRERCCLILEYISKQWLFSFSNSELCFQFSLNIELLNSVRSNLVQKSQSSSEMLLIVSSQHDSSCYGNLKLQRICWYSLRWSALITFWLRFSMWTRQLSTKLLHLWPRFTLEYHVSVCVSILSILDIVIWEATISIFFATLLHMTYWLIFMSLLGYPVYIKYLHLFRKIFTEVPVWVRQRSTLRTNGEENNQCLCS